VGPTAGLDDMEKRKSLPPLGLELRPLSRRARNQSLYRYVSSQITILKNLLFTTNRNLNLNTYCGINQLVAELISSTALYPKFLPIQISAVAYRVTFGFQFYTAHALCNILPISYIIQIANTLHPNICTNNKRISHRHTKARELLESCDITVSSTGNARLSSQGSISTGKC
jgi:hypothetical protein